MTFDDVGPTRLIWTRQMAIARKSMSISIDESNMVWSIGSSPHLESSQIEPAASWMLEINLKLFAHSLIKRYVDSKIDNGPRNKKKGSHDQRETAFRNRSTKSACVREFDPSRAAPRRAEPDRLFIQFDC